MSALSSPEGDTPPPASPQHHLAGIDALRGLAALYVVLYHLPLVAQPHLPIPAWTAYILMQGGSGVALFFVISAFTLTLSVRKRGTGSNALFAFYTRRIFRIVPLYYVWLALTLLRDHFLGGGHLHKSLLLCLVFGYNVVPGQSEGIVWASWTLGVEMLFYLIFPFLFRVVNNLAKSIGFLGFSLFTTYAFQFGLSRSSLVPEVRDEFYQHSLIESLPLFAAGMVAFFVYERWIKGQAVPPRIGALLLGLSVVGFVALAYVSDPSNYQEKVLFIEKWHWFALVYGFLVLGLTILPVRWLVNAVTRFYGDISYSVYLGHTTVVLLLSPVYQRIYALLPSSASALGLCLLVTLALVTPVAWLTYTLVEQPFMKRGSDLIKRFVSKPEGRTSRQESRLPPQSLFPVD